MTCSIDGCEKPVLSRKLCAMHYMRLRTTGDTGQAAPMRAANGSRRGAICRLDGCTDPVLAKDMCIRHYDRNRLNGHPGNGPRERRRRGEVPRSQQQAERRLKRMGVTLEQYERMLTEQDGRCAICGRVEAYSDGRRWCVDHDHSCCPGDRSCGKCVRGLLCHRCNFAIGLLNDDPEVAYAVAKYLGYQTA
jgi:hypothetical protein